MNRIMRLELFREIRKSRKRYISILLIVALGVAFYAGVRSSGPDMKTTIDTYYDECQVMDIRLVSTWGFTDEDVEAVSGIDGVEAAAGYRSVDCVCPIEDKTYNICVMEHTPGMNEFSLSEGRLPQTPTECVIDAGMVKYGTDEDGLEIGDVITVEAGSSDENLEDTLQATRYTIVGIGSSPWFFSYARGTCTTGDGNSDGYILVSQDAFVTEYYTQMFVRCTEAADLNCFTDAYQDRVDAVSDEIALNEYRICTTRYEDTREDLQAQIDEAQAQIDAGTAQLDETLDTLNEKEAELAEGLETLETSQTAYDEGLEEYNTKKEELEAGEKELLEQEDTIESAQTELETAKQKVSIGKTALAAAQKIYDSAETEYQGYVQILEDLQTRLDSAKAQLKDSKYDSEYTQGLLQILQDEIDGYELLLDDTRTKMDSAKAQMDSYQAQITQGEQDIATATEAIAAGNTAIAEGKTTVDDGWSQLTVAKTELDAAKTELDSGWATYEEGRAALDEAWTEYNTKKAEADEQLADARDQLADAKDVLESLEMPKWYYFDRNSMQVYVEYSNDADRIDRIGRIFPLIFFLVAALVALTTMTRMVDEQRGQIGTMKALGYENSSVAARFMIYALTAAGAGSVLGVAIGEWLLPRVILQAYGMMYSGIPHFIYQMCWGYALTASAAALGCIGIATLAACAKEFVAKPAALMRPVSPKSGHKILLERIPFLWKHIRFSIKATIRNLCRYKKRLVMTVAGIGGCMGILVTSFGLRDSIYAIAQFQFRELMHYDANVSINTTEDQDIEALEKEMLADLPYVDQVMAIQNTSVDVGNGEISKSTYMMIPDDYEEFSDYIMTRDRKTGETYTFPATGVAISEKLAMALDKQAGDTIEITYDDVTVEAEVMYVFENYINHYLYMSKDTFESLFHQEPEYASYLVNMTDSDSACRDELATQILADGRFSSVSFMADTADTVGRMMNNLNMVIIVLIVAGGLLAFVVLFNLNNINITERRRELATLEVLGFYDGETAMYVYRENIVLTLLGIAAGIFFGRWLHAVVVQTVEVDVMMFGRTIHTASYCYSALLTLLFAVIINAMMLISIRQIDMVESLKSVE